MMKMMVGSVVLLGAMSLGSGYGGGGSRMYEVTFTNLTHGMLLTPPIFSLSEHQIDVFNLGEPASLGVEMLAEGGITDELRAELEDQGVQDIMQTSEAVMPGHSILVMLKGNNWSRLNLASMMVPTNDGFVAMNGNRVWIRGGRQTFFLRSNDAGTEMNAETCDTIPGPQCGGEGFNPEGGEGFVAPHPGTHGEADLARSAYNWGEPVAKVTVRVVH